MKNFLNYLLEVAGTVNPLFLVAGMIMAIVIIIGLIYWLSKVPALRRDNFQQKHPKEINSDCVGLSLKVIIPKSKKIPGISYLGYNISTNHPFGAYMSWYKTDSIPADLLLENFVVNVEDNNNGGVIFSKGDIV